MVKSLEELLSRAIDEKKKTISVAVAQDKVVLEAVIKAVEMNIINAILVGDEEEIKALEKKSDEKLTFKERLAKKKLEEQKSNQKITIDNVLPGHIYIPKKTKLSVELVEAANSKTHKENQEVELAARCQELDIQKSQLEEQQKAELEGKGVDVNLLEQYRKSLDDLNILLSKIENERPCIIRYRDAEQNLFAKEPEIKKAIKDIELHITMIRQR